MHIIGLENEERACENLCKGDNEFVCRIQKELYQVHEEQRKMAAVEIEKQQRLYVALQHQMNGLNHLLQAHVVLYQVECEFQIHNLKHAKTDYENSIERSQNKINQCQANMNLITEKKKI